MFTYKPKPCITLKLCTNLHDNSIRLLSKPYQIRAYTPMRQLIGSKCLLFDTLTACFTENWWQIVSIYT